MSAWMMCAFGRSRIAVCGFDGVAQVHADDRARAPFGHGARMPPFAAAAFEHQLAAQEIGRDRRDPVQELLLVVRLDAIELQPLRAEIFRRLTLRRVVRHIGEAGHAAAYRIVRAATRAAQTAGHDFQALAGVGPQRQLTCASRANQEWKQRFFHVPD
jgi:hypothetical protein